jgi:Flp pilus assembly protein TadG
VRRSRDERGTAMVEFSWLAILLIVPLVYVLLAVFDVQRSAYGATAGAHAAGRAFSLAREGEDEEIARQRAFEAARVAMRDQGVELEQSQFEIVCDPACLQPDSTVTVRVHAEVPLPFVPDFLGADNASVTVDAEHTETYCQFCVGRGR